MDRCELVKYAKDNGYNSVCFSVRKDEQHIAVGKFIDAYYEFIKIPVLGNGFTRLREFEEELSFDADYRIVSEEDYKNYARLDFLSRGMIIPDEFSF